MAIRLENGNIIEESTRDRRTYIGGSDIAAILGISKYKTALDVYNAKVNDVIKEDSILFELGRWMEPLILSLYQRKVSEKVNFSMVETDCNVYSFDYPFFGAQLDFIGISGLANNIIVADAKNVKSFRYKEFGEDGTCDIPFDIICQVAWQRYLTEAHHVDVPVFFAEQTELKIFTYYKDSEMENAIVNAAMSFWHNNVLAKVEPEAQNSDDLKNLFPVSKASEVVVGAAIYQQVQKLKALKAEAKEIDETVKVVDFEVRKAFGDSDLMTYGADNIATYKSNDVERLNQALLKKELPEVYQRYLVKSTQRTLRLK